MRTSSITRQQFIPLGLEEVFPFFAEARNLERITPSWLRFEVLTPEPIVMAAGTIIDYRLRWRGLPIRWQSEISVWEPPYRFVDRQLRGPYRLWHHEHRFEARDDGTLAIDTIEYAAPFAFLSHPLSVDRDVAKIFDYRRRRLDEIFPGSGLNPQE